MKLNKGTILKASCEYIRSLQKEKDAMARQQQQSHQYQQYAKQYADRVKVGIAVISRAPGLERLSARTKKL